MKALSAATRVLLSPYRKICAVLERSSLGVKLYGAFGLLFVLLLGISSFSLRQILEQRETISALYNQTTSADWLRQSVGYRADMLQYLWTAIAHYEQGARQTSESDLKDCADSVANFTASLGRYHDELDRALGHGQERGKEPAAFRALQAQWNTIEPQLTDAITALRAGKLSTEQISATATKLSDDLLVINDNFAAVSEALRQNGMRSHLAAERAALSFRTAVGVIAVAAAFIFLIVVAQVRTTIRNLRALTLAARHLQSGDILGAETALPRTKTTSRPLPG